MPADGWQGVIALAQAVGEHALGWFLLGLALFCTATALAWRRLRRSVRARLTQSEGAPSPRRLMLAMALGFVLVAAPAMLLFSALGARIVAGHPVVQADHALGEAVGRSLPPAAVRVFGWLTHAGDPSVLTGLCVVVALLLWQQRRRTLALAWVLSLAGNAVLNPALKQAFERARPAYESLSATAHGYSFPSGHSSGAMVAYGMLGYLALRTLPARWHGAALVSAVALVFTAACSRVMLQVHFASDVFAGLASGGTWLLTCITSAEAARHYQEHRALRRRDG
ncbi:MAG: phosphatase PAP2 family protein [Variovorax sp.]